MQKNNFYIRIRTYFIYFTQKLFKTLHIKLSIFIKILFLFQPREREKNEKWLKNEIQIYTLWVILEFECVKLSYFSTSYYLLQMLNSSSIDIYFPFREANKI